MSYKLEAIHRKALQKLMQSHPKHRDGHPGHSFIGGMDVAVRQLTRLGLVERVPNPPTGGMLYLTRKGRVVCGTIKHKPALEGLQVSDAQKDVLCRLYHAYHRPHPVEDYNKRTVQSLLNKKLVERYRCEGCPNGAIKLTKLGVEVRVTLGDVKIRK